MFLVWLFWWFVLAGGLYMGLSSLAQMLATGATLVLALNVLVYASCALAAVPRVLRLLRGTAS
jgi:hypothetical protein